MGAENPLIAMDTWGIVGGAIGIITTVVNVIISISRHNREWKQQQYQNKVVDRKDVLNGYSQFSDDLLAEVKQLREEIASAKARIDSLEKEREEWHRERLNLLEEISRLKITNSRQQIELDRLRNQVQGLASHNSGLDVCGT